MFTSAHLLAGGGEKYNCLIYLGSSPLIFSYTMGSKRGGSLFQNFLREAGSFPVILKNKLSGEKYKPGLAA